MVTKKQLRLTFCNLARDSTENLRAKSLKKKTKKINFFFD